MDWYSITVRAENEREAKYLESLTFEKDGLRVELISKNSFGEGTYIVSPNIASGNKRLFKFLEEHELINSLAWSDDVAKKIKKTNDFTAKFFFGTLLITGFLLWIAIHNVERAESRLEECGLMLKERTEIRR
ncbi:hypothetical protein [Fischerella sp. PCC 9605]|uniref:hypothetical protein n=1 Tax=Fischerella sp. PCC 9605 TaxID=1173024 RepID=UPI00047E242E|nr:hypothetical protein [Fischerella sp. PCC 9605]